MKDRRADLDRLAVVYTAVIAGLLSVSGCIVDSFNEKSKIPVCSSDRDCPESQVCRFGYCSVKEPPNGNVDLEFIPSRFSNYKPQRTEDFKGFDTFLNIGLKPSVEVRNEDKPAFFFESDRTPPSGLLLFEPLTSHPERFSQRTFVEEGEFSVDIAPGDYRVRFMPISGRLPSYSWRVQFQSNTVFRRELTSPVQNPDIEGVIRYSPTDSDSQQPLQGATVYAVSRDDNNQTTSAVTDENGSYRIQGRPNSGAYDLIVDRSSENPWVPHRVFENAFVVEETSLRFSESLGDISLSPVEVTVNIDIANGGRELGEIDLSGSRLIARAEVGDNRIRKRLELERNRRQFFAEFIPEDYTLTFIPPFDSILKRTTVNLDMRTNDNSVTIELAPKPVFVLETLDSRGNPVPNSRVFLKSDRDRFPSERLAFQVGDDGTKRIRLNTDTSYDGFVSPPSSTGLPKTPVQVDASEFESESDDSLTVSIRKPFVFRGQVLDSSQTFAIPNTQVLARLSNGIQIGYGKTDAQGRFQIVLPASL